jgi:hypothetical protein
MNHYAKLGAVIMRSFGLLIMVYSIPVVIWGAVRMAAGERTASDGSTPIRAAFLGWLFYGLAGLLLFSLAKPLGRLAARGFEDSESVSPAA